jgi:thiol-disulfide isomerase/thioredoxin
VLHVAATGTIAVPQLAMPRPAMLQGTLSGYVPGMNTKVKVTVNNFVTGLQEGHEAAVDESGAFQLEIPLITTTQVSLEIAGRRYYQFVLLSPGETSTVRFEPSQVSFSGANAEINSGMESIDLQGLLCQIPRVEDYALTSEMTADAYKSYITGKAAELTASLAHRGLTRNALAFAAGAIRCTLAGDLLHVRDNLADAFRRRNGLKYSDPLTGFTPPAIGESFYSFLKEMDISDPQMLYYFAFRNLIDACRTVDTEGYAMHYIPREAYQALIDSGRLSPGELDAAAWLKGRTPDSPGFETAVKSGQARYVHAVINTGRLDDDQRKEAGRILALCADTSTTATTAKLQVYLFRRALLKRETLTRRELDSFYAVTEQDTAKAGVAEQVIPFEAKYREALDRITERIMIRKKCAALSRILGTDECLATDLLETQLACEKLYRFIPLADDDLQSFARKRNRFYFDYLTAKNSELKSNIEENRRRGAYTVHDTIAGDGGQAFAEIVRPFAGKVVFVDFWNTWCVPCLLAMKEFEPSKAAFKEKGVVFIYLADESSPLKAWSDMIPGIPGEHFRLKGSQMEELRKKFGVKGFPSYMILNRQGEQVYFRTGFNIGEIESKLDEELRIKN